MHELYFQWNTLKAISLKSTSDEHIPLSIEIKYDKYSNTHNWIEYQTPDNFIEIKYGKEFGELISFTIIRHKHYKIINSDLQVDEFAYYKSAIAITIDPNNEPLKETYLDGFYYTIKKSCDISIYNNAIKATVSNTLAPKYFISSHNFGILIDLNLNICSFVLKEITPDQHQNLGSVNQI